MNVAGVLATILAAPPGEERRRAHRDVVERAIYTGLAPAGREPQLSSAVEDFSSALERGEADELADLLTPVDVDAWVERGVPGVPAFSFDDYEMLRESRRPLPRDSALVRALRTRPHLEARRFEGGVLVTRQDGGRDELTVDLLRPVRRGRLVRLQSVQAQLDGRDWRAVAAHLQETAEAEATPEPVECDDVLLRGPDGRWQPGCAPAACRGKCDLVDAEVDHGLDLFVCVCDRNEDAPPVPRRATVGERLEVGEHLDVDEHVPA